MIKEQLFFQQLDISLSPVELFARFAHQPWAQFLDSASDSHPDSRFDIIVFSPSTTIESRSGKVLINGIQSQQNDPLTLLQSQLDAMPVKRTQHDFPFSGGALGYFSYDLGEHYELLPTQAKKDIYLPEMAVGIYFDALIFDQKNQQWSYIAQPNFDRLNEILPIIDSAPLQGEFKLDSNWQANMTEQAYHSKFAQIQDYLKAGDCYQINLAQRFSAEYSGDPWTAYLKLRDVNSAPFSAYINHPDGQILSISPERFIKVHDRRVETKPIKGTRPRFQESSEDNLSAMQLKNSAKDRAENVMIVDLLRNDLGKVAKPGSVEVSKLFAIESFPAVHHLVSTVCAELAEGFQATDQLRAAFPGGSITGAPKIRAMEIIDELEPHHRSIYCGAIGYLSACGNMDTNICIRTLICQGQQIYCWAGGGIVADSKPSAEYQETFDKVNKILPVLD